MPLITANQLKKKLQKMKSVQFGALGTKNCGAGHDGSNSDASVVVNRNKLLGTFKKLSFLGHLQMLEV